MDNIISKETLKDYKVGVVGLGPVGMITAVHLKEAGCNVAICDHDKRSK